MRTTKEATVQKHRYGFGVMNDHTGGIRCKTFWGHGATEPECKADAYRQALSYTEKLTDQAYEKACQRDRSGCKPPRWSYQFNVIGCTLWQ